jgi:hypothetical protein
MTIMYNESMNITDILNDCELTIDDCVNAIKRYGLDSAVDILYDNHIRGYLDYETFFRCMASLFMSHICTS